MKIFTTLAAVGTAACLTLAPVAAHAAEGDLDKAGDYLAKAAGSVKDEQAADLALALAATGGNDAELDKIAASLEKKAGSTDFGDGQGPQAAKFALVAAATGHDPKDFGTNLLEAIEKDMDDEGAIGEYPGVFSQSLGIMAFAAAGEEAPDKLVQNLVDQQITADTKVADSGEAPCTKDGKAAPEGAFGFPDEKGNVAPETDSTAMALMALTAVEDANEAYAKPAQDAEAWLTCAQQDDGSWPGFSPVNSTGLAGAALAVRGVDVEKALTWLEGMQLEDGGFPNSADGKKSDLLATAQGVLLLGEVDYATLGDDAGSDGHEGHNHGDHEGHDHSGHEHEGHKHDDHEAHGPKVQTDDLGTGRDATVGLTLLGAVMMAAGAGVAARTVRISKGR